MSATIRFRAKHDGTSLKVAHTGSFLSYLGQALDRASSSCTFPLTLTAADLPALAVAERLVGERDDWGTAIYQLMEGIRMLGDIDVWAEY